MVHLVVAYDRNGLIGSSSKLPWHIKEDLRFFKELTDGGVLIIGSKTLQSLPKLMPGREIFVLSKNKSSFSSEAPYFNSLEEAITAAKKTGKEIFISGGSQIYTEAFEQGLVDRAYVTHIDHEYDGDVHFEPFTEIELRWRRISSDLLLNTVSGVPIEFATYEPP